MGEGRNRFSPFFLRASGECFSFSDETVCNAERP